MPPPVFSVKALDHVVLTVRSIPATVAFYTNRLGMKHETFVSGVGEERYDALLLPSSTSFHPARSSYANTDHN